MSHQLDEFGILGVVKVAVRDPELRNCRGIQFLPSFCFGIKDQGRVQSDVLPSVGYPNLEHDFLTVLKSQILVYLVSIGFQSVTSNLIQSLIKMAKKSSKQ